MDTMADDDASRKATEMLPDSLISLERHKMYFTTTNSDSTKLELDILELQKQPPNADFLLLKDRESVIQTYSTETSEDWCDQPQNGILTTPSAAEAIDLQADWACKVFCITAQRPLQQSEKEEQESVTKTDKLSLYCQQDADEALAESHTSKDTNADTSIHPDCNRQGEALEDKPPGGYGLPAGTVEDERQVKINVSRIQVFNLGSSGEEVRFQSDCTPESALHGTGVHGAWSQFEDKERNQKERRVDLSSRISPSLNDENICPGDYAGIESFYPNQGEEISGNLIRCTKTKGEILQVLICDNINVAWDKNLKGNLSIQSDKTNFSPEVELACNITAENVNDYTDYDFCASKDESAAGKAMIKSTDHTTETSVPTRIREEPTEGDYYPGPFSVIDPEVWSEADRDGKEGRGSVLSTASTEKVSVDDQNSRSYYQSEPEKCKENDLSNPEAKPQASSITCGKASPTYSSENSHVRLDHQRKSMEKKYITKQSKIQHIFGSARQIETNEFCKFDIEQISGEEEEQTEHKLIVHMESTLDFTTTCETAVTSESDHDLTVEEDDGKVKERETEDVMIFEDYKTNLGENHGMLVKAQSGPLENQQRDKTEMNICECICELKEDNCEIGPVNLQLVSRLGSPSDVQKQALTAESRKDFSVFSVIAFAPASDAVVPCQPSLNHSQNGHNLTTHDCNDRFSKMPSVLTHCDRMPEGFGAFGKIQLSPAHDGEEDATRPGKKPVFTSSLGQLLKTSEGQLVHSMPGTEGNESEEIPVKEFRRKEDVTSLECHPDIMSHTLLNSDSAYNEFPNFTSAEHNTAPGYPNPQLYSDSNCQYIQVEVDPSPTPSTVVSDCANLSDVSFYPDFEMKKEFDTVLKELNFFFQISKDDYVSDSSSSTPQQCGNMQQISLSKVECDVSHCKNHLSSNPELGRHGDSFSERADEDSGGDPVVGCTAGSCHGEQEVPPGSHLCHQTEEAPQKQKEPGEREQKRTVSRPLLFEQLNHAGTFRRLGPLKTCTRPIRVGLSKRAKTRHHLHPYSRTPDTFSSRGVRRDASKPFKA